MKLSSIHIANNSNRKIKILNGNNGFESMILVKRNRHGFENNEKKKDNEKLIQVDKLGAAKHHILGTRINNLILVGTRNCPRDLDETLQHIGPVVPPIPPSIHSLHTEFQKSQQLKILCADNLEKSRYPCTSLLPLLSTVKSTTTGLTR